MHSGENPMPCDQRQHAPATARNRGPILEVLRSFLPASGLVLEVASGTGEHAVHFAQSMPDLTSQPSDPSREARRSIDAWRATAETANVLPPLDLDAASDDWPIDTAAAMICIIMTHISAWASTEGLMAGAGRHPSARSAALSLRPFPSVCDATRAEQCRVRRGIARS